MTAPRRPPHRTVDRIDKILEAVARAPGGLTLTGIAAALEAPVSSVQTLVNGLTHASYLSEEDRHFTLGAAPYILNLIAGRAPVQTIRPADLALLHDITGVPVVLGIAVGNQVVYIDHAASANSNVVYSARTHIRRPLVRTCTGRMLLAHAEERDLRAHLESLSPEEKPYAESFLDELDTIRATGLAISHGYMRKGFTGVAAPVFERDHVVAAIALVGTTEEVEPRLEQLGKALTSHTSSWSRRSSS